MKAMRTMITIIGNSFLEKEDIEYLRASPIAYNCYLTSKTSLEVKRCLYGVGYNNFEVIVSKIDKECYASLKVNNTIVEK